MCYINALVSCFLGLPVPSHSKK